MHPILPILFAVVSHAAAPDTVTVTSDDDRSYSGSAGELSVTTPRVAAGGVRVDGALDEPVWDSAAVLHAFTQYDPVEGAPASQETEVLVLVTPDAILFGIRARDDDPGGIRATLAERDQVARSDDYVRVILDTFHDRRRAYVFTVNPLGVQQDGLWVEGGDNRGGFGDPIDDNPDFLWESGGLLQPWGWSAELRVPFKSLRFPDLAEQGWGLNVVRRIQRTGYQQSWAPLTSEVSNRLAQTGTLEGLRDLETGLFLELNPVLTARRVGTFDADADALVHDDPEADFGFNLTYGLTTNLTLDATYNPDFSQVEADAGQIVVNERFAVFFPEKRPFFLEGTEIFGLPRQLVYTRSIANPVGGAKLTGKVGALNVGYLGAVDELADDGSDELVNLLRVRRDFGSSSTAGLVYTDRSGDGAYNRMGGADTRLVFGGRHTLSLLGALSRTGAPDQPADDGDGSLLFARFERSGRSFSYEAELEDVHPEFRAGSGFIRRTGDTQGRSTVRYNLYGPSGALFERVGPFVEVEGTWERDDFWNGRGIQERTLRLGASMSLRGNLTGFFTFSRSAYRFDDEDFAGLFVPGAAGGELEPFLPPAGLFEGMDGVSLRGFFSTWQRVRGNFNVAWREQPVFDRTLDVPVERADVWTGELSLTLVPTRSLRAEVGVRHERLRRQVNGTRYSTATIPRLRAQYQFSRAFFVRGIAEYGSQERGRLIDPVTGSTLQRCDGEGCQALEGSQSHDVHVELLAAFEPSPGTVLFLGYSRDMEDPEAFGFRNLSPRNDGIFVKASYRFRY